MVRKLLYFLLLLFVSNLNLNSQSFTWVKQFKGASDIYSRPLVVDTLGNIYVAGYFRGTVDFDPGSSVYNLTASGVEEAYIAKLSASGNLIWAKKFTGGSFSDCFSIALDEDLNILVTGSFTGVVDFDPGPNTYFMNSGTFRDAYILKLNSNGDLIWAKQFDGKVTVTGFSLSLDSIKNIYVTGSFYDSTDFDPGLGTSILVPSVNNSNGYVCKLDSNGIFIWVKQIKATSNCDGWSIHSNKSGELVVSGGFKGIITFDSLGTNYNIASAGNSGDTYVLKLDANGNFLWAKRMGGTATDIAYSMTVDVNGDILTTGYFQGTADFDPSSNVYNLTATGDDIFICKLNQSGKFVWARQIKGNGSNRGFSVCTDKFANVYITGYFVLTANFNPNGGSYSLSGSSPGTFTCKLNKSGYFLWANEINGNSPSYGYDIYVDNNLNVYTTGNFRGTIDADQTIGKYYGITSAGMYDVFIHKMGQCSNINSNINKTVCYQLVSPSGIYTWNSSGLYHDTISRVCGGDSLITINLVVNQNTYSTIYDSACYSYVSPSGNYVWTSTGTYTDKIPNSVGCDSVITVNLKIKNTYSMISASACGMYTAPSGKIITSSGLHFDTIPNSSQCDSIITISLLLKNTYSTLVDSACSLYISPSGKPFDSSGVYIDTIPNKFSCDSIITIYLTIKSSDTIIYPISCKQYLSPGGNIYYSTGLYIDTLVNSLGCDSLITINLNVINVDTSVYSNQFTLIANASNALYQWIDCSNNQIISGANSQLFTPSNGGSYAVIVTQNGCVDTSNCYTVNNVGISKNLHGNNVSIYPNPTKDIFLISYSGQQQENYFIYDLMGKEFLRGKIDRGVTLINLEDKPIGVYILKIGETSFKVIRH